jgi:transcriptional regulator with XRE-family HTH domain
VLCARLRDLRKAHGFSLVELAQRLECSVGYLSQMERGLSSPSLRIIVALSEIYDVELSELFSGGAARVEGEHRIVVRRSERARLDLPATGIAKEALTEKNPERILNLYEMVIAPGGRSGDETMTHAGEECGVVLEGRMVLEVDGRTWELEAGDSFRFPSTSPHRYGNLSTSDVRVLWTTTTLKPQT